jgi:hypothetical protein
MTPFIEPIPESHVNGGSAEIFEAPSYQGKSANNDIGKDGKCRQDSAVPRLKPRRGALPVGVPRRSPPPSVWPYSLMG